MTPLPAVWADGALHFRTGPEERKARVVDEGRLRELAAAWEAKYGGLRRFDVRDGAFHHGSGYAYVFAVAQRTVFGFGKGEPFSQTRWRFE